jgi:hypothetical protein
MESITVSQKIFYGVTAGGAAWYNIRAEDESTMPQGQGWHKMDPDWGPENSENSKKTKAKAEQMMISRGMKSHPRLLFQMIAANWEPIGDVPGVYAVTKPNLEGANFLYKRTGLHAHKNGDPPNAFKESSTGGSWSQVPQVLVGGKGQDSILTIAAGGGHVWVVTVGGVLSVLNHQSKQPSEISVISSPNNAGKCVSVCVSPKGRSVWASFSKDGLTSSVHKLKDVPAGGGSLPTGSSGWEPITPQIEGKEVTRVCPTGTMPKRVTA